MKLTFLGATQTVTGSKFLLDSARTRFRVLIECGLFQGLKELRLRNWDEPPVDPKSVDAVILTHAHIDHSGYLPRFVKQGFRGSIYATAATIDLLRLLLPDAGHLQEEEARYRNKHNLSKHKPALPLYTVDDAVAALGLLRAVDYRTDVELSSDLRFELLPAGHILGSAFVRVREGLPGRENTILFTGDIGRYDQPIIHDPSTVENSSFLVLESTYGNRLHSDKDGKSGKQQLRDIVIKTARRGGTVLIPSFAVGRAQELLYVLRELEEENQIPILPVYVDSPMAVNAFEVYNNHHNEHDAKMTLLEKEGKNPLYTRNVTFSRAVEDSKRINDHRFPSIIISANGMATGGRILHHLINRLPDERNSLVFVGFQAAGTRGRLLADGARTIRIFGQDYPVRAAVHVIDGFSAHGDYQEIQRWLRGFQQPPRSTFLVHGEPSALQAMKGHIERAFPNWGRVAAPQYLDSVEL